jgi:hypothetical protein
MKTISAPTNSLHRPLLERALALIPLLLAILSQQILEKYNERTKYMKTMTNIIYPAFAVLALACFSLGPTAQAVDPPPDGGYPGENTAEGDNALFNLTSGADNTAVGSEVLSSNTTGNLNTAIGSGALLNNTTGSSNTLLPSKRSIAIQSAVTTRLMG